MKVKYSLSLLAAIILTAGSVLAQQTTPPAPEPPDEPVDQNFEFFLGGDGFLGVYAENISRDNMARYHVNPIPPGDLMEDSLPAPAMGAPVPVGGTPAGATPGETMENPTGTPSGR